MYWAVIQAVEISFFNLIFTKMYFMVREIRIREMQSILLEGRSPR